MMGRLRAHDRRRSRISSDRRRTTTLIDPDLTDYYYSWLGIPAHELPPDHYRLLGLARIPTDGTAAAAMLFAKGKLNGVAVMRAAKADKWIVANYKDNERHGPMRVFNSERKLVLYSEFTSGNRTGITCLFDTEASGGARWPCKIGHIASCAPNFRRSSRMAMGFS